MRSCARYRMQDQRDAPGGTRTPDQQLRRLPLYPSELLAPALPLAPTRGPDRRSAKDPPHLTCPTTRSGRPDSNRRPPAPKAGAIPGYATPRRSAAAYVIPRVRRGQRGLENPLPLSEHTTPVPHWLARRALAHAKHLRALNAPPDVRSRRERPRAATTPQRHDRDD